MVGEVPEEFLPFTPADSKVTTALWWYVNSRILFILKVHEHKALKDNAVSYCFIF